jgi:hypothetical protein
MKTKKLVLFILGALISSIGGAQVPLQEDPQQQPDLSGYYYHTTHTISMNGYAYQCDVKEKDIAATLYNKENRLTYANRTYKDGSPLSKELFDSEVDVLQDDNWTKSKCVSIVNNAIRNYSNARGCFVSVSMYIDPNTGKVMEVKFRFVKDEGMGTVPVSAFREIEINLKNNVWFTPTAEGKKLNFLFRGWRHKVE